MEPVVTAHTQERWPRKALGATGLMVPPLCIGTSELSGRTSIFPNPPGEQEALATVRAILDGPIPFLDTAAGYGESERRIGVVLRERGGLPPGFVLSTKVDPDPQTRDYSGAQAWRSVERSLTLLGLDHLQLVYLHDPENTTFEQAMAPDGPVAALQQCRDEGVIAHIGVAGGPIDLLTRYVETGAFEVVLSHNRYTLLNVAAGPLWDLAGRRGRAAVNAAPYGGGILSKGPTTSPKYAYRPASADLLARAQRLEELCVQFQVPLAAAALQFSMRDPRIASTVVGISRPERLAQTIALAQHPISDDFWSAAQAIRPDTEDLGQSDDRLGD
jgi:D-threo-aldose 1-dehydrogenase